MTEVITPSICSAVLRTGGVSINDQRATADARRAEQIADAWATWLRSFRWSFFTTGTFEKPVTGSTALRVVESWLSACRGGYAAVGLQRGPVTLAHHVHMLVGGVARNGLTASMLRGSWVKDGHVLVERFTPTRGGVEYLVRQADVIELLGDPQTYRSRKRGSRGG
jgi:hypothetical protein